MYVRRHVMYVHMAYIRMYVCVYVDMSMYVCTYTGTYVCMCVHTYVHTVPFSIPMVSTVIEDLEM